MGTREVPTVESPVEPKIRGRRVSLGLSQAAAAERAGISRRLWSEIELGRRRGSAETLAKMDRALGWPEGSAAALERNEPVDEDLATIRRELIALVNELTTKEQLEQARLDLKIRQIERLQAQLDQYRAALGEGTA